MRRSQCQGCKSTQLVQFLDLGNMPLAGGFLAGSEEIAKEQTYPLPVHVCESCGLVQTLEVVDPEIMFQNYSFSSSTIGPLVKHFEDYAAWLKQTLNPHSVVEFGCNDGALLKSLEKLGIEAHGVDPSKNITQLAREKGLQVTTAYFRSEVARTLRERLGQVDLITGSNVFAHNHRPELILEAAKTLLKPDGHLCLEVMYAGALLDELQWDTLYHEHSAVYSLASLTNLLQRHGFHVVSAQRIPMHNGSLRVTAGLDPKEPMQADIVPIQEHEQKRAITSVQTWITFGERSRRKIQMVAEIFGQLSRHHRIAAYGASGKATMWVNACKMDYLLYVVDASPFRAGKLMPGVHTPIVFPNEFKQQPPDYVLITAWNYADVICAKESWFRGVWSVPLPDVRFF